MRRAHDQRGVGLQGRLQRIQRVPQGAVRCTPGSTRASHAAHVPDVRAYIRCRTTDEELNRRLDEYYASGVEAPKYAQGPVAPR